MLKSGGAKTSHGFPQNCKNSSLWLPPCSSFSEACATPCVRNFLKLGAVTTLKKRALDQHKERGEMVLFPLNLLAAFQQKGGRCRKYRESVEIWGFLAMIGHHELRTGAREAPGTGRGRIKHGAGLSPVQGLCSAWRGRRGAASGAETRTNPS